MIALNIDISGSGRDVSSRVARAIEPARINPVIGRAAVNHVRSHLFDYNRSHPNWLGGKRTNYYLQAGRNTSFKIVGNEVVVSINQVGMRLRFYGGKVKPRTAKFLAIPAAPEAHGKRPREFGDLELVFGEGGRPIALATPYTRAVQIKQNARGKIVKKMIGRRGKILFRLVKSVTQKPDPAVLPTTLDLAAGIISTVNQVVERARGKGGKAS